MQQSGVEREEHNHESTRCCHCSATIDSHKQPFEDSAGRIFCCPGCRSVYELLSEKGLLYYYTLSQKVGGTVPTARSIDEIEKPSSLTQSDETSHTFLLEGIHCASCVWLLERLPDISPGVRHAHVQLASGSLFVRWDPSVTSAQAVQVAIEQLGYRVRRGDVLPSRNTTHSREQLTQIGIAGACAMNIMVLAVSLYQGESTGIDPQYEQLFRWVSFALAIPVVAYSAVPIYRRALGALRAGALHIDIPIALGIALSCALSAINTIRGAGEIYFDSLTTIVFLLLSSRFVQHRAFESTRAAFTSSWSLLPETIHLSRDDGGFVDLPAHDLRAGMLVQVFPGERLPCDGVVEQGSSSLDCSTITGESLPQGISVGAPVLAGSLNLDASISVRAATGAGASQLDRILTSISSAASHPPRFITSFDTLSMLFTAAALLLAVGAFLLHVTSDFARATSAAIAMLTVTCPCAVALALPLLSMKALAASASRGILVKTAQVFEDMPKIKTILLDKTGTLTEGTLRVVSTEDTSIPHGLGLSKEEALHILSELVSIDPQHPVSRAIAVWLTSQDQTRNSLIAVHNPKRIPGRGVSLSFSIARRHQNPLLGTACLSSLRHISEELPFQDNTQDGDGVERLSGVRDESGPISTSIFSVQSRILTAFYLSDTVRITAPSVIDQLSNRTPSLMIISGDAQSTCNAVARDLALPPHAVRGELTPTDKAALVTGSEQPTLFVGDGANDAPGLSAATIGVALRGGIQSIIESANVCIVQGGVEQVVTLRTIAAQYAHTTRRIIVLGVCYNGIGIVAALCGVITPLVAAVAMPIFSSVLVMMAYTACRGVSRADIPFKKEPLELNTL